MEQKKFIAEVGLDSKDFKKKCVYFFENADGITTSITGLPRSEEYVG